jgi:hypothetical protein
MEIAIFSTMRGFSWGGSEELWYKFAIYAKSQSHNVTVIVFENLPISNKIQDLIDVGCKVYIIQDRERIFPSIIKKIIYKLLNIPLQIKYSDRFFFLSENHFDFVLLTQSDDPAKSNRLQEVLRLIPSVELVAFIPLGALKAKDYFIF